MNSRSSGWSPPSSASAGGASPASATRSMHPRFGRVRPRRWPRRSPSRRLARADRPRPTSGQTIVGRSARPDRAPDRDRPRAIGRYELLEVIGEGAAGIVYRGRDTELGRQVAVKVPGRTGPRPWAVPSDSSARRSAAGLRHPNIVPVYDAGRDGDTLYLVSAFVRGTDLARRFAGGPPGHSRTAARLVAEVAEALDHARTARG